MWPTTVAYSQIAPFYDCTVGVPFFLRLRASFEKLVEHTTFGFARRLTLAAARDCSPVT